MSSGSRTAAELSEILSAPAVSIARMSSAERMPPPTVYGMKTLLGGARRDVEHRRALLVGRGDVEEDELVGARLVVDGGQLDRIAGVAQVHEVDAFDDAPLVDVEARDDALHQHAQRLSSAADARAAMRLASSVNAPS